MKKARNFSLPLLLAAIVASVYLAWNGITGLVDLISNVRYAVDIIQYFEYFDGLLRVRVILNLINMFLSLPITLIAQLLLALALWVNAFKPIRPLFIAYPAIILLNGSFWIFADTVIYIIDFMLGQVALGSVFELVIHSVPFMVCWLLFVLTTLLYCFRKTRLLAKIGGGLTLLAYLGVLLHSFCQSFVIPILFEELTPYIVFRTDLLGYILAQLPTLLISFISFSINGLFMIVILTLLWLGILFDKREKQKRLVFEMPVRATEA